MIEKTIVVLIAGALLVACDREQSAHAAPPSQAAPAEKAAPVEKPARAQPSPAADSTPAAGDEVAALGKPAPDFTLTDTEGKTHALAALRGKTVVLEWFNPDCPFVRHAHSRGPLVKMASRVARPDLVWLAINSNAPGKQGHGVERNRRARSEYAMPNPVLLDEAGRVGKAYGAEKTPHMFVIDPAGKLVFRGGIDNAPMGEVDPARPRPAGVAKDVRVNYVDAVLEDLQKQRPLRLTDTPAYGCTVKYAT
jgi:peroxiredoxin